MEPVERTASGPPHATAPARHESGPARRGLYVLHEVRAYTRVVEECVERILRRYVGNPRAGATMERAQRTLHGQVPMLRARVQSMLGRLRLSKGAPAVPAPSLPLPSGPPLRVPLANGTYSELEVHAKSIGWKGRVDLLVLSDETCEVTDFKTGAAGQWHEFQIRVYAVLWRLDDVLNPSGRAVDRLVLAYEGGDVEVAPPSAQEIDDLSRDLLARRMAAEMALAEAIPEARPAVESCRYCGVRQLCDAYWAGATHVLEDGRFGDIELEIIGRHGLTSWDAVVVRARKCPEGMPALLRLQQPHEFRVGSRVRVLDGLLSRDPEEDAAPVIVALSALSEIYFVD